uniref:NADH dehydrogenase subunit 6 n=1 Tax=Eusudasina nantouensis TaxID=766123 RepID=UPI002E794689|nr:NADH dehydrogenase subunit 6 [Eusudasina nantouensis]WQB38488.1 NADH dehydrogenase subunit 6 [Eusudasina nantouensis]
MNKVIILNSIITPWLNHPISLGSMLMVQTMLISMKMFKNSNSSWFSYILFITIIGGMMVMFMYMASIASNEKFNTKSNLMNLNLLILTIIILPNMNLEMLEKKNETKMMMMELEEIKSMSKFFNFNKMNMTISMLMILLVTMIVVTSISNSFEGPLKKK